MTMFRRTASTFHRLINYNLASNNCTSFASPTAATSKITEKVESGFIKTADVLFCSAQPADITTNKSQLIRVTYRLYSSEFDLSDVENRRRTLNRLLYRSKQRGLLELDLVLGNWVEENIHAMDENGIKSLVQVLDLENPDLWNWLSGQEQPPESVSANPVFTAVHEKVASNLTSHSAPETRATPGKPWVRGWDDIKRGKDSPLSGNQ